MGSNRGLPDLSRKGSGFLGTLFPKRNSSHSLSRASRSSLNPQYQDPNLGCTLTEVRTSSSCTVVDIFGVVELAILILSFLQRPAGKEIDGRLNATRDACNISEINRWFLTQVSSSWGSVFQKLTVQMWDFRMMPLRQDKEHSTPPEVLKALLKRYSRIKEISLVGAPKGIMRELDNRRGESWYDYDQIWFALELLPNLCKITFDYFMRTFENIATEDIPLLPQVEHVHWPRAQLRRVSLLELCSVFPNLKTLDVSNGCVRPSRSRSVPPLTSLEELKLCHCGLTSSDLLFPSTLVKLDLTGNEIEQLPETFCLELQNLEELLLTQNQLTALPEDIGELRKLKVLDLANNMIEEIPDSLASLTAIETLNLDMNALTLFPPEIHDLVRLKVLDLSSNTMSALGDISSLAALESFSGIGIDLEVFPTGMENLKHLTTIILPQNSIFSIPARLCELTQLEVLDLQLNNIEQIPKEIGNLKSLKELVLAQNKLSTIPAELGECTALQTCEFGENEIETIECCFSNLSSLQVFAIENNELTHLPDSLFLLPSLQQLLYKGNPLQTVPKHVWHASAGGKIDFTGFRLKALPDILPGTSIYQLHIPNNDLALVPDSIGEILGLKDLDLSANRIKALPETLGNLSALRYLALSGNKLQALPTSIGSLVRLERLRLALNDLSEFPTPIYGLRSLRLLDMGSNNIQKVSPAISKLQLLKVLNLNDNRFFELPAAICDIFGLLELHAADNILRALPGLIGNLGKLEKLMVQGNRLESLPPSISSLERLERLDVQRNCLTVVPDSIGNLVSLQILLLSDNPLQEKLPTPLSNLELLLLTLDDVSKVSHLPLHIQQVVGNQ